MWATRVWLKALSNFPCDFFFFFFSFGWDWGLNSGLHTLQSRYSTSGAKSPVLLVIYSVQNLFFGVYGLLSTIPEFPNFPVNWFQRTYSVWFQSFKIYWGLFYCLRNVLSWKILHVSLKRMCILWLLDRMSYKYVWCLAGFLCLS
jgi:hypothetical protein